MKRHISYESIGQFRHSTSDINFLCGGKLLPTVKVIGSEKIHGSNAAICYSNPDGFWTQSRKNIITPQNDYKGCARTAHDNQDAWKNIIKSLAVKNDIDLDNNVVSVYFEWAGGNIQKQSKSALSGLDKRSVIFQYFKVSPLIPNLDKSGQEIPVGWFETRNTDNYVDSPVHNIWNIMNFPTIDMSIDFNNPDFYQNKINELVKLIENESLVGKKFGIDSNVGEGYVFTFKFRDKLFMFKVKGDKHAQKVKQEFKLTPVDEELENQTINFVNNVACVNWRLDQMFEEIVDENDNVTMKLMGTFLNKVINDVMKEESDLIVKHKLNQKTVIKKINEISRKFFISEVKK